jgi:hypothetical protein
MLYRWPELGIVLDDCDQVPDRLQRLEHPVVVEVDADQVEVRRQAKALDRLVDVFARDCDGQYSELARIDGDLEPVSALRHVTIIGLGPDAARKSSTVDPCCPDLPLLFLPDVG